MTRRVSRPLSLDLAHLAALPQHQCVIRHVCVEGWSAIVAWSGPRLADVVALAGLSPLAGYVFIESADQYYASWDLASALHPQTLLATHMNGAPLPARNGGGAGRTGGTSGSPGCDHKTGRQCRCSSWPMRLAPTGAMAVKHFGEAPQEFASAALRLAAVSLRR